MKTIAIHQPAYMAWLGYWHKMAQADCFVYLDTVQFEKNSFINRNRILTPQGEHWLSIPVSQKGHTQQTLQQTTIVQQQGSNQSWQEKHLKTLQQNYSKAPFAKTRLAQWQAFYESQQHTLLLAEFCWHECLFWRQQLSIQTPIIRASQLTLTQKKSNLVLEICQQQQATQYLSGALGKQYLEADVFAQANIIITDLQYPIRPYAQSHVKTQPNFVPYLSVLDAWLNVEDVASLL